MTHPCVKAAPGSQKPERDRKLFSAPHPAVTAPPVTRRKRAFRGCERRPLPPRSLRSVETRRAPGKRSASSPRSSMKPGISACDQHCGQLSLLLCLVSISGLFSGCKKTWRWIFFLESRGRKKPRESRVRLFTTASRCQQRQHKSI